MCRTVEYVPQLFCFYAVFFFSDLLATSITLKLSFKYKYKHTC